MKSPQEALTPDPSAGVGGGDMAGLRKLPDLQKNITMAQIAKQAGVSQGAISSLLNDRDYGIRVSEKTRERVFKVCREMGYIPNDLRAVVRMYPEFGDFCLLVSDQVAGGIGHPHCARVLAGMMASVPDPSHPLTLGNFASECDYTTDADLLPHPARSGVVSKFMCFGAPNGFLAQALTKRGFPVVSVGYDLPVAGVTSVVPDYARAAQLALEHLAQFGHRQIGLVSGPLETSDWPTLELNRGVHLAADQLRVSIEPQHIIYSDLTPGMDACGIREMLSRKPAPTAVFCLSDGAAAAVLATALSLGIEVPRQLSVVGCGDDPCVHFLPWPLTTVQIPMEELGRMAVQEIDRLVRGPVPGESRRIVLPASMVTRSTTAAPTVGK